ISNASANIRSAASTTQSSCLPITAECRSIVGCEPPSRGANSANGHHPLMLVAVVASPRFEPANLSRTESGEERLTLHKNHEGRAQAARAMGKQRDRETTGRHVSAPSAEVI